MDEKGGGCLTTSTFFISFHENTLIHFSSEFNETMLSWSIAKRNREVSGDIGREEQLAYIVLSLPIHSEE